MLFFLYDVKKSRFLWKTFDVRLYLWRILQEEQHVTLLSTASIILAFLIFITYGRKMNHKSFLTCMSDRDYNYDQRYLFYDLGDVRCAVLFARLSCIAFFGNQRFVSSVVVTRTVLGSRVIFRRIYLAAANYEYCRGFEWSTDCR